jgi:hypothetical protein
MSVKMLVLPHFSCLLLNRLELAHVKQKTKVKPPNMLRYQKNLKSFENAMITFLEFILANPEG